MKDFLKKLKKYIIAHKLITIFITITLVLVVIAGCLLYSLFFTGDKNEKLTRGVWAELLKNNFGFVEYQTEEPFFTDIQKNDDIFVSVQALKEREIIEYNGMFEVDKAVSFDEMLTHISKVYGTGYICSRLKNENATKSELNSFVRKQTELSELYADDDVLTVDNASAWLNAVRESYLSREFGNKFTPVYKKNVKELTDISGYNVIDETLIFTSDIEISTGDILLLAANEENISGAAYKVENIVNHTGADYTLSVSVPEIEEVFDKFDFEFSQVLDAGEFIPAEGITVVKNEDASEENDITVNINPVSFGYEAKVIPLGYTKTSGAKTQPMSNFTDGKEGTFFDQSITVSSDTLSKLYGTQMFKPLTINSAYPGINEADYTDSIADGVFLNENGQKKNKYDAGFELECGLKLSDFKISGCLNWRALIYASDFTVTTSMDVTPYFKLLGNSSTTVNIGSVPCALPYGFQIDVALNAAISINGDVSIEPTIHCLTNITKDAKTYKLRGTGNATCDTEATLNGDANFSIGPDVTLSWLNIADFADVYAYVGVGVSSNYNTSKPNVITASVYLPTLHIGVGENEDTLLSKALGLIGHDAKADLAIIDNTDNALFRCPYTTTKEFTLMQHVPMTWGFKDGVLTVSGVGKIPDYIGENTQGETLPPWYRGTQEVQGTAEEPNPVNLEIKKIVIEDGICYIGAGAFSNLSGLTEVVFSDSVVEIGDNAFAACEALEKVSLPSNLKDIGIGAFSYCTALKSITLGNKLTRIGAEAFTSCSSLEEIGIPDSVETIGVGAFSECTALKDISLGTGVTKMGREAFAWCTSIEKVTLPQKLVRVPMKAFYECSALKEVVLSTNTREIGMLAFGNCRALSKCNGRDGVEKENGAFYNCIALGEFNYGEQEVWEDVYFERTLIGEFGIDGVR